MTKVPGVPEKEEAPLLDPPKAKEESGKDWLDKRLEKFKGELLDALNPPKPEPKVEPKEPKEPKPEPKKEKGLWEWLNS